jgi:flagellar protein FlaG
MGIEQIDATGTPVSAKVATSRPATEKQIKNAPPPVSQPIEQTQETTEQVRSAMQDIQEAIKKSTMAQDLHFSIDNATGKTIVKVVDATTQEVVRQIPSEEILAIARSLDRMQGVLLKQKA